MKMKVIDLVALVAMAIVATWVSVFFSTTFLVSTLLYFALPIAYLGWRLRARQQWKRIVAMAFIFGAIYGFLFDYVAEIGNAWSWPAESYLPYVSTVLGVVNTNAWIWVFLWIVLIVLFYEHFMERDVRNTLTVRVWYALLPGLVMIVLVIMVPQIFVWEYSYLALALLTLPPAAVFLYLKPNMLPKIAMPALFFVPLHIAHEYTGLILGQWIFSGTYIGAVHLHGAGVLPLEEFVIWILLGSIIVLSYYELYIDDMQ